VEGNAASAGDLTGIRRVQPGKAGGSLRWLDDHLCAHAGMVNDYLVDCFWYREVGRLDSPPRRDG
jgi:hypothetical protein